MKYNWKINATAPLKIINYLVYLIPFFITVGIIVFWNKIPEQIPYHWNGAGEIDDFGGRGVLIFLLFMILIIMAIQALLVFAVPHLSSRENLFEKKAAAATDEDYIKGINYILYLISGIALACEVMFAYIIICGALNAELGVWFLPAVAVILCAPIVFFLWKLSRLEQQIMGR